MPNKTKQGRVNMDMKREISAAISGMKDPRLNEFLSVNRVDVTADKSYAKVFVGSLNGAQAAKEACELLTKAKGHIKTELAKVLRIRKIPDLTFIPDDSVDYYNKINSILEGLKDE
ncbi:MAG: 30S ribosome-binding factor RbfA [Oscillospiraceae bacterium]